MEFSKQGQPTASTGLVSQQLPTNTHPPPVQLLPVFHKNFPGNWGLLHSPSAKKTIPHNGNEAPIPIDAAPYPLRAMNQQSVKMEASRASAPIRLGQLSPAQVPFRPEQLLNIQTSMPVFLQSQTSPSANKRLPQMEAPSKSQAGKGVSQSANKRPAQTEPLLKVRSESFEAVRSKLRESLAALLASVTDQQSKKAITEKSSFGVSTSAERQVDAASSQDVSISLPTSAVDESEESRKDSIPCRNDLPEFQSKHASSEDGIANGSTLVEDELLQGHGLCWVSDLDAGTPDAIAEHDTKRIKIAQEETTGEMKEMTQEAENLAFRIEAELFRLFGGVNKKYKEKGRSLLFNLKDRSNPELRERVLSGDIAPERLCTMSAEDLASKELSQWRLAKAEELAQMVVLPDTEVDIRRLVKKTHKGEFQVEMEESDAPSVEVELGATVLSRVPLKFNEEHGAKSNVKASPNGSRSGESEASDGMVEIEKAEAGNNNLSSSLETILNEKTDLMQELMVDELKDTDHLPPVLSLDEFMQALDSEPPFENLSADTLQDVPSSGERNSESDRAAASDSVEPDLIPLASRLRSDLDSVEDGSSSKLDSLHNGSEKKSDHAETALEDHKVNNKNSTPNTTIKSNSADFEPVTTPPKVPAINDSIWEGVIQLSASSLANVIAIFRSGEKPTTNEWSSFVEIKGRVRLDAFEKFLHELPLSRSRAIMIAQFCWKEGSPESGRLNLTETIDSYSVDERVGFAEPAPGVELYLCPPHAKTVEMLIKLLSKEHSWSSETLLRSVNDLIGVVVWRRPHVSVSPRVTSHNKNSSTKKQLGSRLSSKSSRSAMPPPANPNPPEDDVIDDDVPPGFGPAVVAKDEDDLPEFDFVNTSKISAPVASRVGRSSEGVLASARPMEQMRELIHKYGQGEGPRSDLDCRPWNDDEDDIPEWNPEQDAQPQVQAPLPPPQLLPPPPQQLPPPPPLHSYNQLPQQHWPPFMPLPQPLLPLRPQMGSVPGAYSMQVPGWQPNLWWQSGQGQGDLGLPMAGLARPSHFAGVSGGGQVYGMARPGVSPGMGWRPDVPGNNRGA